jgi:hypothetical protein
VKKAGRKEGKKKVIEVRKEINEDGKIELKRERRGQIKEMRKDRKKNGIK